MHRTSRAHFPRSFVGHFVAGDTWLHFCAEERLWGMCVWGRPTEADIGQLVGTLVLELSPPAVPHASLVDLSRLEAADQGAFEALGRYVAEHTDGLGRAVQKLAMVRPPGFVGALVAGAWEVLPPPYPVATFDNAERALEWLGVSAARAVSLTAELAAARAEVQGASPFLTELRGWLDAHLTEPSLERAAKVLEASVRTVQRRLSDEGTSFEKEVMEARVRCAQRLLGDREAKLTAIALEAGFASLQQLNTVFTRVVGVSPRDWKDGKRKR